MKQYIYIFILLGFCFESGSVMAQDAVTYSDDAAIWFNLYLEKKLSKHFEIHLNQQDRLNENVKKMGMGYSDVGITYSFNKNIKIMADYVFIQRRKLDESYSTRHQFYVALCLRKDIGRWRLLYRNMVQSQVKDVYSSYDGAVPVYYERNKFTAKYELNKYITPYVAQEIYYPLYQETNRGFDRSRSFVGFFYNFSKQSNIEFYFMYQHELNASQITNRDYIYGIGYSKQF